MCTGCVDAFLMGAVLPAVSGPRAQGFGDAPDGHEERICESARTQTLTDRQTDRQTDGEIWRQTGRQTGRQTDRQADRQRGAHTHTHTHTHQYTHTHLFVRVVLPCFRSDVAGDS